MPTINIGTKEGNAFAAGEVVSFEPRNQPVIIGTYLLIGPKVSATTDANGTASITLAPGDYDVTFASTTARCIISVPDDANTYDLTDLITSGTTYVALNVLTGGASWTEQGSNPSTPSTGQWKLFFKSSGLYILDDAGTATLLAAGGEANLGSNVGASGVGVFDTKSGVTLQFNKILGASGISASLASNVITISASGLLADIAGASLSTGDVIYYDGANLVRLAIGSESEVLTVSSGGVPEWAASGAGVTLPVVDTTALVKGSVDATKLVRIEADGITTGTTRVLTMPDSDVTLVANPVSESGSQTLTNKTISGTSNTITNLAASAIASGTLAHEQGGLEADVSAYDGILKISAGATSAVTLTSFIATLLDDTDATTARATLGAAASSHTHTLNSLTGTLGKSKGGLDADIAGLTGIVTVDPFGTYVIASSTFAAANHTHAASNIVSGTLAHERGGLEADVSAYSGLVKIDAGATSAVTITSFMESLLDDANASAARSTLQVPGALDDLSDVSVSSPFTTQALFHNGSNWSNRYITTDDLTAGSVGALRLPEISAPSTPASGTMAIYPKTDNKLYAKNDAGTEYDLTAGVVRSGPLSIITEATTTRTLALTDIGDYIRLTNASSCTITLPANATVDWAGETYPPTIYFEVAAAGIPTLSASGVTVNDSKGTIAALVTGDVFALQWVGSDAWTVI